MTRPSRRLLSLGLGALLCLAAHPLAAQYSSFGKNKIQYRDFNWHIYHSPHFNVYFYDEEEVELQKVVSFAESAYDQLSREFNYQIKDPVPLIFYATHSAFEQNNVIQNFIPEGVGAFASPGRFRMVMPVDSPDGELLQLMLHELTHIFQYHILFQGTLSRAVGSGPPTWFMEGMASYMAKDESSRDKMFLRDAVVNDRIPSVTRGDFGGFFAYRFGHAVFDFIEERWGKEGFLDFIYEVRNTLGSKVDRAVKRTFRMEPEDFDIEFRRWLRKKYLPELIKTGEPSDFGRIFRVKEQSDSWQTSPVAAPSGDLVAAITTYRGDVDVALFDARKRQFVRNLTRGFSNEYQYLVAQEVTLGRGRGRDLAFSPDGNRLAVFAKRERGRSLILLDVLNGGIDRIIEMNEIEQQLGLAWSPDGKKIAFSGFRGGQFDVFEIDLESRDVVNLTNDDVFDGAPTYSPDGKSVIFVSAVGDGYEKLFRLDRADLGKRYQVTTGKSNENDPTYSPDGKRVYFTSDRDGADNIYSLDLATGATKQYTNVVTGASMPTVLRESDGGERLVFNGYWKMGFDLYVTDVDQPLNAGTTEQIASAPTPVKELARFEPDIQVTIDDSNKEKYSGRKFFLEDAQSYIGVDSNQTLLGQLYLTFSDYLGDHRIQAQFGAVESFSNFNVSYTDQSKRWQWQVGLFDTRDFFIGRDQSGFVTRGDTVLQQTGAVAAVIYPFSFYRRAELGVGYILRKYDAQEFVQNADGQFIPVIVPVKDDFPIVQGSLVGDSAVYAQYGAVSGRRWRLDGAYAPDLDQSGTKFTSLEVDARQYLSISQRSNLALRLFAGAADGNQPNPFYFGGLDTVRGVEFRSLVGDRAFFANVEYRFPLVDLLATPILGFQGIRGVVFFDVGGAYFNDFEDFKFFQPGTHHLQDAVASYGFGISTQLLGLDVNWDFAKRYDVDTDKGYKTSFWVGTRF